MRSGRTLQLLPQPHTHTHTHTLPSPYPPPTRLQPANACVFVCVCVLGRIQETELWMSHFELRSTGRSEGSQTAFWDIIQPPTQQMCRAALSLPRLSQGVFLLGKQHLEFAVYRALSFSLLWVCYLFFLLLLCLSPTFSTLLVNTSKYLWAVCRRSRKAVWCLWWAEEYTSRKTIWDLRWIFSDIK